MRILHINASYKPAWIYGGPTVSISGLCEELVSAGIHTEVFTTTANGERELEVTANEPTIVDGVTVTYFTRLTKDHTHFSPKLLLKLWRNVKQYDVIHIHAWWNMVSILSCLIALKRNVPVVVSPRGMLSSYSFNNDNVGKKGAIHRFLGKSLLSKVNIHVTAESEKREIENLVHPKSFAIIPNLIQLPSVVNVHRLNNAVFKIIFLSRIDAKKGLDILLEALAEVKRPWLLTIVGEGEQDYINHLHAIANRLNIFDNIIWAGFAGDEKFQLLSEADLFVLPSHNENFGNVVIESLSVGTAVLVSHSVGLADYVKKNRLGWTSYASPQPLAERIEDIILNRQEELKKIRNTAPEIIRLDFNKSTLVKQYIDLYIYGSE